MKRLLVAPISLMLLFTGLMVKAQELNDIVQEVSEAIKLDETQTKAFENQLTKYSISLKLIFDRYEQAEPDPQAMLTDIKYAQDEYHSALSKDIGKSKFKEYEAFREKIILEILGEAAHLRLLDLQEPMKMTDGQVTEMKPVMAKAMRGTMQLLMKHIDSKLNVRTKLNIATSLKSIKNTFDQETAKILTTEQIRVWNEIKEAAKEEN